MVAGIFGAPAISPANRSEPLRTATLPGAQDRILLGIVALIGWVDYFMDFNAMDTLSAEVSRRLPGAIARVSEVLRELDKTTGS